MKRRQRTGTACAPSFESLEPRLLLDGAPAALNYVERTVGAEHYLDITAEHAAGDIWEMTVNLGRDDGHGYWAPGQIAGFKDVAYGNTPFDYSSEANSVTGRGLFVFGSTAGQFTRYDATFAETHRGSDYYEFTWSGDYMTNATTDSGVDYVVTVRINAPTVSGITHITTLTTETAITNPTAAAIGIDGMTQLAEVGIGLNAAGYENWPILNPFDGATKPNTHANDATDGHQLYELTDFYGSNPWTADGHLMKAVVKNNPDTQALNMRPGLTFEMVSDFDLSYADVSRFWRREERFSLLP